MKVYTGAQRIPYHHFERSYLKCRLVGTANVLSHLCLSEVKHFIAANRIIKDPFLKNARLGSDVGMNA